MTERRNQIARLVVWSSPLVWARGDDQTIVPYFHRCGQIWQCFKRRRSLHGSLMLLFPLSVFSCVWRQPCPYLAVLILKKLNGQVSATLEVKTARLRVPRST